MLHIVVSSRILLENRHFFQCFEVNDHRLALVGVHLVQNLEIFLSLRKSHGVDVVAVLL